MWQHWASLSILLSLAQLGVNMKDEISEGIESGRVLYMRQLVFYLLAETSPELVQFHCLIPLDISHQLLEMGGM